MAQETPVFDGLDGRQAKAVLMYVEGRKFVDIRRELDISEWTWWDWRNKPAFWAAVEKAQGVALRTTAARLHQLCEPALETLERAMNPQEWTTTESGGLSGIPASAIAAARDVLERAGANWQPSGPGSEQLPSTDNVYAKLGAWAERSVSTRDEEPDE